MLYHIISMSDWQKALDAGIYSPPTLESGGFVHCSTADQVIEVANELYRGQEGLMLLVIDLDRLEVPTAYEDCYQTGQKFPHIYGPLPIEAVLEVRPFTPGPDGLFSLPE